MAQQREEAWKKIHKAAMDNPIKDKVQGYDQVFRLTYNHVSIFNLQWWKSEYFSKRFQNQCEISFLPEWFLSLRFLFRFFKIIFGAWVFLQIFKPHYLILIFESKSNYCKSETLTPNPNTWPNT